MIEHLLGNDPFWISPVAGLPVLLAAALVLFNARPGPRAKLDRRKEMPETVLTELRMAVLQWHLGQLNESACNLRRALEATCDHYGIKSADLHVRVSSLGRRVCLDHTEVRRAHWIRRVTNSLIHGSRDSGDEPAVRRAILESIDLYQQIFIQASGVKPRKPLPSTSAAER